MMNGIINNGREIMDRIIKERSEEERSEEERIGLCALNRIFGFEPRVGAALVEAFGGAAEVFRHPQEEIVEALIGFGRVKYASQIAWSAFESAAIELEGLQAAGCCFVGIGESGYPSLLKECEDPPLGLYFRGTSPPEQVFGGIPHIAVIGTRDLTSYGREWCRMIVEALSKSTVKPLIVSGLAIGVDITAHTAALDSGLPTVAVMATGIDRIYPPRNKQAGERIAATEGCALVTDYPPGTVAARINFLRRNRIIAGICRATILVESRIKGGGMMTARLASSYDRDVFALPGRLDDPASQGCNLLIRQNIAEPVGDLEELMAKLGAGRPGTALKTDFKAEVEEAYKGSVDEADFAALLKVALTVKANRGISIDEICLKMDIPYSRARELTTILECDGFISIDLLQHCSAKVRLRGD